MAMDPKSSATVVVTFDGTCPVRSISALTEVMAASVLRGGVSEMEPTAVVFPTPKPPAMTILTGVGGRRRAGSRSADRFESTDDPLDHVQVRVLGEIGPLDGDVAGGDQVGDEHSRHADVQTQPGGDLGDRHRL